jgi:hypothetical protein
MGAIDMDQIEALMIEKQSIKGAGRSAIDQMDAAAKFRDVSPKPAPHQAVKRIDANDRASR